MKFNKSAFRNPKSQIAIPFIRRLRSELRSCFGEVGSQSLACPSLCASADLLSPSLPLVVAIIMCCRSARPGVVASISNRSRAALSRVARHGTTTSQVSTTPYTKSSTLRQPAKASKSHSYQAEKLLLELCDISPRACVSKVASKTRELTTNRSPGFPLARL